MSYRSLASVSLCCAFLMVLCGCPKPEGGSLVVHLEPAAAVTAGAQWRVDGGAWQATGATVDGLGGGRHTVEFGAATGWYTPGARTVDIVEGETSSLTQAYLEAHAAWEEDTATYDVTLDTDTVYIDEANLDLLLGEKAEEWEYEFDAAETAARGIVLEAGDPLLIHGIAARRIESVTLEGETLVVETEFAPLNEVISDGVIAWDYGVEFTPEKVRAVTFAGKRILVGKDTIINQSFTIGQLTYTLKLELNGPTAKLEFSIEKDLGGSLKGKFEVKGNLTRFRSRDTITLAGGSVTAFDHGMDAMRGDLELALVVTASGNDFVNYKLPVPLLEIPFVVGAVPVTLKIGAQFVINASVPYDGSARVTTGFNYDTDLGFSFNGVQVSAAGNLAGIDLTEGVHETGASSAISANFGLGFPRVSLGIFGNTIVPWAQTAALVGGSYTVYPACQTADAQFLGAAGIDLSFLGFPLFNASHTFFEHKEELLRTGDCPEGSKEELLYDAEWYLVNSE